MNRFSQLKFNPEYYRLFERFAQGTQRKQEPHTLFIGCSDSRIVPAILTRSSPGEVFVIRNIANMVPPYRESSEYLATISAIEYAVNVLKVKNIIVCGHSNCGGCEALYYDITRLEKTPQTAIWLELAKPVKDYIETHRQEYGSLLERDWKTEQMNVILQLDHLMTYPYIAEKVENGELGLHAWYFMLEAGKMFVYSPEAGSFVALEDILRK